MKCDDFPVQVFLKPKSKITVIIAFSNFSWRSLDGKVGWVDPSAWKRGTCKRSNADSFCNDVPPKKKVHRKDQKLERILVAVQKEFYAYYFSVVRVLHPFFDA